MDLSALTDAELTALKTAALASITSSASAQSYTIGSRTIQRMSPTVALEILSAVSREQEARTDTVGDLGVVEFGAPQ